MPPGGQRRSTGGGGAPGGKGGGGPSRKVLALNSTSLDALPPNSQFHRFQGSRDPAAILRELSRGLRSQHLHEQCETIIFFERLIKQHPVPVVVNTALLKLADVFFAGPNLVRFYVRQVLVACRDHLTKAINVDELVRRLASVLQSNDPIARVHTLHVLAHMGPLLAKHVSVHHDIRASLLSPLPPELEAGIVAVEALSAHSAAFASGSIDKLVEMTNAVTTDMVIRTACLSAFRKMHHTVDLATRARGHCLALLERHPTRQFTIRALETLSDLVLESRLHAAEHARFLCGTLAADPRAAVRRVAVRQLCRILPVLLAPDAVDVPQLADAAQSADGDPVMAALVLRALHGMLVSFPAHTTHACVLDTARALAFHDDSRVCSQAFAVWALLVAEKRAAVDELVQAFSAIAEAATAQGRVPPPRAQRAVVDLVRAEGSDETVAGVVADLLQSGEARLAWKIDCVRRLALGRPQVAAAHAKDIWALVDRGSAADSATVVAAYRLLCAAGLVDRGLDLAADQRLRAWDLYAVARSAATQSQATAGAAAAAFRRVRASLESETNGFWMMAVEAVCRGNAAAARVLSAETPNLLEVNEAFASAQRALQAAEGPQSAFEFQRRFVAVTLAFFRAGVSAASAWIDDNLAAELQQAFSDTAGQYRRMARSFVDMDANTMLYLEAREIVALVLARLLDRREGRQAVDAPWVARMLERAEEPRLRAAQVTPMLQLCRRALSEDRGDTEDRILELLCETGPVPPFFFNAAPPSVAIELSVSVATGKADQAPVAPGDPISVTVSGLIKRRAGCTIRIAHIELAAGVDGEGMRKEKCDPQAGYVSWNLALSAPAAPPGGAKRKAGAVAMHEIVVEVALVDADGRVWAVGPRAAVGFGVWEGV